MNMHTDDSAKRFLTKNEEQRFGENLRKALIYQNPNPSRKDCPDPKTIRDLAFHKKIGDAQLFEQVTNHIAECSACVRDALAYTEEYKEQKRKKQRTRLALAAAAAVVLSLGLWAILRIQPKQEMIVKSPEAPIHAQPNPVVADAGIQKNRQPEIAQLEPFSIEFPARWRGPPILSKRRSACPAVKCYLRSVCRSAVPKEDTRSGFMDGSGKVRKTAAATAGTVNGVTILKCPLDTSNLSPGNYKLSILEPGLDEWSDYPFGLNSAALSKPQ